ncbi:hypothetical protein RclHR1_20110001 [Rhizophagus clarus]|uniref:Uncharacterized protein n=1 Tax=Rhizophagus clarus TaxID=94130 RepID=A0A2Z6RJ80_9GLOM|nr:hypothetical protein RclHR1_20110001 [Rhizophagus clarus]
MRDYAFPSCIDHLDDLKITCDTKGQDNLHLAPNLINNPEKFFTPSHSFLPNVYNVDKDRDENKFEIIKDDKGFWRTQKRPPKNLIKTLSTIKMDKKEKAKNNTSIHKKREDNFTTYDAYISLNDIDCYFHNDAKLAYVEMLARDLKEFAGTEIFKDQEIIVKNTTYKEMLHMVRIFNHRCKDRPFMSLKPKTYFLFDGQRISSKEFKIINVPKDTSRETLESAVLKLIGFRRFFIKKSGIKPSKNNQGVVTVFVTIKDTDICKLLKHTWSIEINNHYYQFALAHCSDLDLSPRKQFRGEFVGFDERIALTIVHEAYVA